MADNLQAFYMSMAPVLLTACISAIGLMRARHSDVEERAKSYRKMLLRQLRMRLATGIAERLDTLERDHPQVRDDHDDYVDKIAQTMNDYLYGDDKIIVDFVAINVRYDLYVDSVLVLRIGAIALLVISAILVILPLQYPGTWSSESVLRWLVLPTLLSFLLVAVTEVLCWRFHRLVDRYEVVLNEKS
ncbi:MAG: hypothetical protein ACYDH4_01745 [Candidatus Cryosericum sp.]